MNYKGFRLWNDAEESAGNRGLQDSKSAAGDSVPVRVRSPAPRAEDLRRRFSALFFERAKENPDIKIVVVWPGQYRSEAFLCDPTVALEKIR